jgi:hypothetical protein
VTTPLRVYLDLNHWYTLGEALAGHPAKPEDVGILQRLTQGVEQGRLEFPLSSVHYMELAENPRDNQRTEAANVMVKLSRFVTMAPIGKVIKEELATGFNRRFGRPAFPVKVPKFGNGVGFAFGETVNFRLVGGTADDRAAIEAQVGMSIAEMEARVNAAAEYDLLAQPSRAMSSQIPGYDPYAARRVADQELASFNVMVNSLRTDPDLASRPLDAICARQFLHEFMDHYTQAQLDAGFTVNRTAFHSREELSGFLMSLPSRRVATMIQFHYLQDVHRDWAINDLRDIHALSLAIPYCDVVVTDKKAWDATANRAHLDTEFKTRIFRRLAELDEYLAT